MKSDIYVPAEQMVLVSVRVLHNISGTVLSSFNNSRIVSVNSASFNCIAASAKNSAKLTRIRVAGKKAYSPLPHID